jgi:hypothetical protein
MADQHKEDRTTLRMPAETKAGVKQVLGDNGWTFQDFALAAIGMLLKRPKTFLAQLEPFRLAERRGRPKKEASPKSDEA